MQISTIIRQVDRMTNAKVKVKSTSDVIYNLQVICYLHGCTTGRLPSTENKTRWIKEAVRIRKEAMNRDEGSYQLSNAYDRLLDATADRRIKTRKN